MSVFVPTSWSLANLPDDAIKVLEKLDLPLRRGGYRCERIYAANQRKLEYSHDPNLPPGGLDFFRLRRLGNRT